MFSALKYSPFQINGKMKVNTIFGTKLWSTEFAYSKDMSVRAIRYGVDNPSGRCMVRSRSG